jgi:hypothetical protein
MRRGRGADRRPVDVDDRQIDGHHEQSPWFSRLTRYLYAASTFVIASTIGGIGLATGWPATGCLHPGRQPVGSWRFHEAEITVEGDGMVDEGI